MEDPMFPNIAAPDVENLSGEEETSTGEQEAGQEASSTENSAGNQEP
jgi:hypothetical protein